MGNKNRKLIKKTYLLSDLKPLPAFLKQKFKALNESEILFSRDEERIYKSIISGEINLETVIVIVDMLKDENRLNKKYVRWIRTERCSLIQERVNRYFFEHNEACLQTAEKIAKQKNIDIDGAYDLLTKRLETGFLEEYRQKIREPQNWLKKKRELTRDRFYYQIDRIYNMPHQWKRWDYRNSVVQTYFSTQNSQTSFISGGSGSSGQRENHSRYGFLFARCQNKGIDIPTHILVYDDHNRFKYLTSSKSLILSALDLGSNYHIYWRDRKTILENIPLLRIKSVLFAKDKKFKIQIGKDEY